MCIVIVNNGGCGIFSFLPISGHGDVFPRFFDHPHAVEFGGVSKMFGIEYRRATTREEFDGCLVEAQVRLLSKPPKHYTLAGVFVCINPYRPRTLYLIMQKNLFCTTHPKINLISRTLCSLRMLTFA